MRIRYESQNTKKGGRFRLFWNRGVVPDGECQNQENVQI